VSAGLLLGLAWWLDVGRVGERLGQLRSAWVLAAVVVSLAQVAASGWRWVFTARRLGLTLSFSHAVREYYLAMFLNQVLPGGVLGDVSRAWRHGRAQEVGPAVRAVILERASGQIVMLVATVAGLMVALPPARAASIGGGTVVAFLGVLFGLGRTRIRRWARAPLVAPLWDDAFRAMLTMEALPWQVLSSVVVTATYVATYLMAAGAVGVEAPVGVVGPLVPAVLMSMVVPVTVAGWGVREAAAAVVWSLAGLSASDGVAVSVAYGLIVFVTTLPGALVLIVGLSRGSGSSAQSGA